VGKPYTVYRRKMEAIYFPPSKTKSPWDIWLETMIDSSSLDLREALFKKKIRIENVYFFHGYGRIK
jgi:hypothetical protein